MLIVGSYHKTGTALFSNIFMEIKKLCKTKLKYKFNNHFNLISDHEIKNNKCIIIIRNPYEMICSGMRYHQISDEEWLHIPKKEFDNETYQQKINSLDDDEKILFEMNNCGLWNITAMYNDIKNRNFNNNILVIKLEDFYDIENLPKICNDIKNHINDENISYGNILNGFKNKLKINYHRTNKENIYTYPKLFKKIHYTEFNKIFPNDLLEILDYKKE
jgi:hypothetical protein